MIRGCLNAGVHRVVGRQVPADQPCGALPCLLLFNSAVPFVIGPLPAALCGLRVVGLTRGVLLSACLRISVWQAHTQFDPKLPKEYTDPGSVRAQTFEVRSSILGLLCAAMRLVLGCCFCVFRVAGLTIRLLTLHLDAASLPKPNPVPDANSCCVVQVSAREYSIYSTWTVWLVPFVIDLECSGCICGSVSSDVRLLSSPQCEPHRSDSARGVGDQHSIPCSLSVSLVAMARLAGNTFATSCAVRLCSLLLWLRILCSL